MTRLFANKEKLKPFHVEVRRVLLLAQIFGLFPVKGITNPSADKLVFAWKSKRVVYALFVIAGSFFFMAMALYQMCFFAYNIYSISTFIFSVTGFLGSAIFLSLARSWPKLVKYWSKVEASISGHAQDPNLKRRFDVVVLTIVAAAAAEHILSIVKGYKHALQKIEATKKGIVEQYFLTNYHHVFDHIPYSLPLAIFCVFINILNVFSWNYLDSFLIVVSIALASRLKQVNTKVISAYKMKIESEHHWIKLREEYNKVSILCKIVNDKISYLILLSFGTNLFFIVSQLYGSLAFSDSNNVYFYFSFGLLVSRTIAVTLYSSNINDESKNPQSYLMSLDASAYGSEVQRFILQIYCQPVALTGHNFFTITRELLFSMVGTIVTYELFLIQSKVNYST